ncbi:MAG: hypothetical protein AAF549_05680 [Pseudomonadota bacterium]
MVETIVQIGKGFIGPSEGITKPRSIAELLTHAIRQDNPHRYLIDNRDYETFSPHSLRVAHQRLLSRQEELGWTQAMLDQIEALINDPELLADPMKLVDMAPFIGGFQDYTNEIPFNVWRQSVETSSSSRVVSGAFGKGPVRT